MPTPYGGTGKFLQPRPPAPAGEKAPNEKGSPRLPCCTESVTAQYFLEIAKIHMVESWFQAIDSQPLDYSARQKDVSA